jgi:hypothetical protein
MCTFAAAEMFDMFCHVFKLSSLTAQEVVLAKL